MVEQYGLRKQFWLLFMENKNPKYGSMQQWRRAEPKAYQSALKMGLLPNICNKLDWNHVYPNAKNYTYKKIGLVCKDVKYLVDNNLISDIYVMKKNNDLFYFFDVKLFNDEFEPYRDLLIADGKSIGFGILNKRGVKPKRFKTYYLQSKLLTYKEIKLGYDTIYKKQSLIYDKIIDYFLGKNFAHLKNI